MQLLLTTVKRDTLTARQCACLVVPAARDEVAPAVPDGQAAAECVARHLEAVSALGPAGRGVGQPQRLHRAGEAHLRHTATRHQDLVLRCDALRGHPGVRQLRQGLPAGLGRQEVTALTGASGLPLPPCEAADDRQNIPHHGNARRGAAELHVGQDQPAPGTRASCEGVHGPQAVLRLGAEAADGEHRAPEGRKATAPAPLQQWRRTAPHRVWAPSVEHVDSDDVVHRMRPRDATQCVEHAVHRPFMAEKARENVGQDLLRKSGPALSASTVRQRGR
mmetsp:Transcript_129706/g.403369  ORF Transcript_129706/g.403369 Transcript_129706/m.403369 type:complete len:277 (+) Transcript_129706:360-1190(+)